MRIILTTLLLFALFLFGCAEIPVSPEQTDNHRSYQLIKLPKKSDLAVETSFSVTETINGEVGGIIWLNESYIAADGHTVSIDIKLKVPHNAFTGNADFTITADDEYAAIEFLPDMVFDIPLELNVTFLGLDLAALNLTNGDYDFVFIDDDGNMKVIGYNAIHVNEDQGKLWVTNADIPHFSRYGFVH